MSHKKKIRDWEIEKYHLGELSSERKAELDQELHKKDEASDITQRLNDLDKSNQDILRTYSPSIVAAQIKRKAAIQIEKQESSLFSWINPRGQWAWAASACALLIGFAMVSQQEFKKRFDSEVILTKGMNPFLNVYRKMGDRVERLSATDKIQAKDLLQVSYVSIGKRYGAVFSVDSKNNITFHLPQKSGMSVLLNSGKEVALPSSFELDQTPGFEKFYFITSAHPFEIEAVIPLVLKSKLPHQFEEYSIEFKKK